MIFIKIMYTKDVISMSDKVKNTNLSNDEISKVSGGVDWKSGAKTVGKIALLATIFGLAGMAHQHYVAEGKKNWLNPYGKLDELVK